MLLLLPKNCMSSHVRSAMSLTEKQSQKAIYSFLTTSVWSIKHFTVGIKFVKVLWTKVPFLKLEDLIRDNLRGQTVCFIFLFKEVSDKMVSLRFSEYTGKSDWLCFVHTMVIVYRSDSAMLVLSFQRALCLHRSIVCICVLTLHFKYTPPLSSSLWRQANCIMAKT